MDTITLDHLTPEQIARLRFHGLRALRRGRKPYRTPADVQRLLAAEEKRRRKRTRHVNEPAS